MACVLHEGSQFFCTVVTSRPIVLDGTTLAASPINSHLRLFCTTPAGYSPEIRVPPDYQGPGVQGL